MPRRSFTPQSVTSHRASTTIRREILDWPCSRSRNVIGDSPMSKPSPVRAVDELDLEPVAVGSERLAARARPGGGGGTPGTRWWRRARAGPASAAHSGCRPARGPPARPDQFVTEPPAMYRLPIVRSCARAAARRPGSSSGSVRQVRVHLDDEVVVLTQGGAEALEVRARQPRLRRANQEADARASRRASARTRSAVPSGEQSSTTRTSTCSRQGRQPSRTHSIVVAFVIGGQDDEGAGVLGRGARAARAPTPRRGSRNRPNTATRASQGTQSPSRTYHVRSSEDRMVCRRIAGRNRPSPPRRGRGVDERADAGHGRVTTHRPFSTARIWLICTCWRAGRRVPYEALLRYHQEPGARRGRTSRGIREAVLEADRRAEWAAGPSAETGGPAPPGVRSYGDLLRARRSTPSSRRNGTYSPKGTRCDLVVAVHDGRPPSEQQRPGVLQAVRDRVSTAPISVGAPTDARRRR